MSRYRISLIMGDGIGPELAKNCSRILETLSDRFKLGIEIIPVDAGDGCLERLGNALPEASYDTIKRSDACWKAPVGETAKDVIVKIRQDLDLYVNLRPVKSYPTIDSLKPSIDFVIVRENTEDLYKGIEFNLDDKTAIAVRVITEKASRRIAEFAFKLAQQRSTLKKVTAVNKRNIMPVTEGLFTRTCKEVASRYKDIAYSEMYVDSAAMNMIRDPEQFDVIVTTNVFGDILSDEAAQLVGGLGLVPSANIGEKFALFEPVHGSAPDIAGKGIANPVAILLSGKMMLDWLYLTRGEEALKSAAKALEDAVMKTVTSGYKTPDLGGKNTTSQVADAVIRNLNEASSEQKNR